MYSESQERKNSSHTHANTNCFVFCSCILKLTGPQLSPAVKHSPGEIEFQTLSDVLQDTFTNTFGEDISGQAIYSQT